MAFSNAAVDWLVPTGIHFNELALFEDARVAVARRNHSTALKARHEKVLKSLDFAGLRPRVDGDSPVPGLQEWLRLKLNCAIEALGRGENAELCAPRFVK